MLEKKYDFKQIEPQMQQLWQNEKVFAFKPDERSVFSIDTPPPTVSGNLHIGHIFSYTQTEMIARYKRMTGHNVFYPFGFDDNGLPSERLVEKEHNVLARDVSREDFAKLCVETVQKYEEEFRGLWSSLGFSVDWDLQYKTISESSQRISQRSFLELVQKGKAYRKEMPVLWCTNCRTSIAQAELESKDADSTFNHLRFYIDGKEMPIATTRPEMLAACVAVLVNPEDERFKGLVGKNATVPLYNFEVPVLCDEKVAIDKGTGMVMCCTFGDVTDLEWFDKFGFKYKKLMEADGTISKDIDFIGGLYVKKARKAIIALLEEHDLLIKSEPINHTVSVHERCGTEVEIIPSPQWYIDILNEKERFLKAADEITWYPEHMKNRYISWVENLKWDWNISRQRYFGVPIPVWYCKACGEIILPNDADLPVNPLSDKPKKACKCGSNDFVGEDAVMDTWATSSVTPLINKKWREADERTELPLPMSMRAQAHEIIRTWAFYTIVKSLYHTGEIPWESIMVSGFVLAKKGEKISKSKNNSKAEPKDLIEQYSADAVRYWAAANRLGTDTWFEPEDVKQSNRFLTKLWNSAKFSIMHLEDYNGEAAELLPADKWIINEFNLCKKRFIEHLNACEVGLARKEIDDFFWHAYCDDYIEFAKERLYQPQIHGEAQRRSAQSAVLQTLHGILQLYCIFVPHMTEYIYQQEIKRFFPNQPNLSSSVFAADDVDNASYEFGKIIRGTIDEVRKYKSEKQVSMKESFAKLIINSPKQFIEDVKLHHKDFKACTSAEEIEYNAAEEFSVEIQ